MGIQDAGIGDSGFNRATWLISTRCHVSQSISEPRYPIPFSIFPVVIIALLKHYCTHFPSCCNNGSDPRFLVFVDSAMMSGITNMLFQSNLWFFAHPDVANNSIASMQPINETGVTCASRHERFAHVARIGRF